MGLFRCPQRGRSVSVWGEGEGECSQGAQLRPPHLLPVPEAPGALEVGEDFSRGVGWVRERQHR